MQDWLLIQFREMTWTLTVALVGLRVPIKIFIHRMRAFFCVATVLDMGEVYIQYINYKMAIDWS
jgi:hypothetical protein